MRGFYGKPLEFLLYLIGSLHAMDRLDQNWQKRIWFGRFSLEQKIDAKRDIISN